MSGNGSLRRLSWRRLVWATAVVSGAVWGATLVAARGARAVAAAPQSPAVTVAELGPPTSTTSEDEFPALGRDADGRLWLAWVSWDGTQDRLLVSQLRDDGWSEPVVLSEATGDHWCPAFGRDGQGRLWLTWAQNDDQRSNWNLWGRYFWQGRWSEPVQLTDDAGTEMRQQLVCDSRGRLWVAWQGVADRAYEIFLAELTPRGLVGRRNVSESPASDWEPAVAADADGRVYVAWDSYRSGSYDILLRCLDGDRLGPTLAVAATPRYEAHAALAVDRQNRVWVAWDEAGANWGRHTPSRQRLHSSRALGLCCLQGNRVTRPTQRLSSVLTGELARFCELPELSVDADGRLWLVFRHLHDLTPPGRRPNGRPYQSRGIWNPYVTVYQNGRWSTPVRLPTSNGRNDMRVSLWPGSDGTLTVAWAEDGRRPERAEEPVNHNVHAATLRVADGTRASVSLPTEPQGTAPVVDGTAVPRALPRQNRPTLTAGGRRFELLFGDTHRHTDISRCAMNYDGSLIDTYRYAIDAARLDFLAISDHDQDLLKHRYERKQSPLQDYAWWRSQKYCDLFYIAGRFLTLYGYEHGGSFLKRGGHKNVVYLKRGNPCYEEDAPEDLFRVLQGKEVVVIPHQLADGPSATDWRKWNANFERVAEIFQARGCYEFFGAPPAVRVTRKGHYLWDALERGVDIGVIASSDHGLVHSAYAAVYAEEFSRRGVLEALRNRRSFGATDTLVLDFRLQDHLLGERVRVDGTPTFTVQVQGTAPVKQVQIVRNNRFVYTTRPGRAECEFRFTDSELQPGQSAYYYVRVQQEDNQWAWSSAIWVERR